MARKPTSRTGIRTPAPRDAARAAGKTPRTAGKAPRTKATPRSAPGAAAKRHPAPAAGATPHAAPAGRLIPPPGGATVRMYRIGHGDCFLIAFAGDDPADPRYVLIDCGYKPGSPKFIDQTTVPEITADIRAATGGRLHVAVITHEHQDHVNGISETNFKDIAIDESWFAWTEDPADELANALRKRFRDKLLGLGDIRNRLAGLAPQMGLGAAAAKRVDDQVEAIDDFLAFELGGDQETADAPAAIRQLAAAAKKGDPAGSANKRSMKVFKDKAEKGIHFLRPHEVRGIEGASAVRVFSLGPPRDEQLLASLDPQGSESFRALAPGSTTAYLAAAATGSPGGGESPFARRYQIKWKSVAAASRPVAAFFKRFYGRTRDGRTVPIDDRFQDRTEAHENAAWRRIDSDWLQTAGQIALDMNDETNNASLVLAFELGQGGKVLLFAGDAQRGNWISWSEADWPDRGGDRRVDTRSLLSRTVLYKVGHHGSHNATLNGRAADTYPNLAWMGVGAGAGEFTALITAVRKWAETQKGWDHPQKAIKDALIAKAGGRVLQTDTDFAGMTAPDGQADGWAAFQTRAMGQRLYFDVEIRP